MALATTTLSVACAASDNVIQVASATSVAAGRLIRIDGEWMQVGQGYVAASTSVPVLRGRDGSAQVAHVITANVVHGFASDFSAPPAGESVTVPPGRATKLVSITATSSLSLPKSGENLLVVLNGTSVITLTVPVPTKDMDGVRLTIVANGAAAHVLTFTGGLGGAGSSYDVETMNGTGPVAFEAIACNALWVPIVAIPSAGTVTNVTATIS